MRQLAFILMVVITSPSLILVQGRVLQSVTPQPSVPIGAHSYYCTSLSGNAEDGGVLRNSSRGKLVIKVDPRIELLSIVQWLGERMENGLDFSYKRKVKQRFSAFRNHRAVQLIKEMLPNAYNWGLPAELGVTLSNPPELRITSPLQEDARKAYGEKRIALYVAALRDFAQETKYIEFFKENEPFYRRVAEKVEATLADKNYIPDTEAYYGQRQHSYSILPSPLMPAGGVGPRIKHPDGRFAVYSIIGAWNVENDLPNFGDINFLGYIIRHEFSHTFVNPLTEKYGQQVEQYELLHYPVKNRLKKADGLTSWSQSVNEHIIRAFTARNTARENGKEAAEVEVMNDRRRGFVYIDAFIERLGEYESNRKTYPTFEAFYPRLIELFKELTSKNLGDDFYTTNFTGPWGQADYDDENMFYVFIIPTDETDKAAQDTIHALVQNIRRQGYKTSFIITDKEALEQDLSEYTLWVWGTPEGNLWLKKHPDLVPQITIDQIVADKKYSGTNLMFVSALPNPENPQKAVRIATGQRARDIGSYYWNTTKDYAVINPESGKRLGTGYYKKQGKRWTFQ